MKLVEVARGSLRQYRLDDHVDTVTLAFRPAISGGYTAMTTFVTPGFGGKAAGTLESEGRKKVFFVRDNVAEYGKAYREGMKFLYGVEKPTEETPGVDQHAIIYNINRFERAALAIRPYALRVVLGEDLNHPPHRWMSIIFRKDPKIGDL